jgi:hypothetical protein
LAITNKNFGAIVHSSLKFGHQLTQSSDLCGSSLREIALNMGTTEIYQDIFATLTVLDGGRLASLLDARDFAFRRISKSHTK